MQSILDHFNNELVKVSGHVAVRHKVSGDKINLIVNSYHNEGCVRLNNDELIAVLKSDDGVIEKVEHRSLPIIGTMWHPEREEPFREEDLGLLKSLIGGNEK